MYDLDFWMSRAREVFVYRVLSFQNCVFTGFPREKYAGM